MKQIALSLLVAWFASHSLLSSEIPDGRLGYPLGKYLEIEGVRAGLDQGKVGLSTLLVSRINDKKLAAPIGIWVENVLELPARGTIILRGYESGKMIGLPHEVAQKESLSLPQAGWQFYRYFVATSVVSPKGLQLQK